MGTAAPAPSSHLLEHTAAQARARVLMDPRAEALKRWQALDADETATSVSAKLANDYESALASSMLRDWARADASIAKALALVRNSPRGEARAERAVVLLQVQSLLDRGDPARAEAALKPYVAETTRPVQFFEARVALVEADAGRLRQSAQALQTWVSIHPVDAEAWSLLSQSWERLGQRLRSLRADAESRYALGDLPGAIDRLRAGQRIARGGGPVDFIEASVIDARLRDIEAQRRQIEKDEKRQGG